MANNDYQLSKNEAAGQYELTIGDEVAGFASYVDRGDVRVLPHTVVDPKVRGQGLSRPLIQYALDQARADGMKVDPACSAVAKFIDQNADYQDLLT